MEIQYNTYVCMTLRDYMIGITYGIMDLVYTLLSGASYSTKY